MLWNLISGKLMPKKTLLSAIIIGIFVSVIAWAMVVSYQITKQIDKNQSEGNTVSSENANVENLVITETKNGQKFWELFASEGQYDNKGNRASLVNIKGYFYNNNKRVLTFVSPNADYLVKNKEIRLFGGPKAVTESKIYISSNEMIWSDIDDKINAKGSVNIIKMPKLVAKGDRAIFSPDFSKIKMIGNTTTYSYKIGR